MQANAITGFAPALILEVGLPAPPIKELVHHCSFCVKNLA